MFSHRSDNAKQEHTPLGKVGAAVLGNLETNKFQLYLYYNKKQQVCNINITSKFNFVVREGAIANLSAISLRNHNEFLLLVHQVQKDVFCNFNDGNGRNWTISFVKEEECIRFASFVAVAKCLSDPSRPLVIQDMRPGKGNVP